MTIDYTRLISQPSLQRPLTSLVAQAQDLARALDPGITPCCSM